MKKIKSFFVLVVRQRYTRFVLLRNVLVTRFIYPNLCFFVFVIVHSFFYPHFPIRIRHPQVSSPRFADTSFASRFFELFTLPASLYLKLHTQRRSAPSMCAFKEEERSVLISVTLGTLSFEDGDGGENVAEKVNSRSFNLDRDYSMSLTLSNLREPT